MMPDPGNGAPAPQEGVIRAGTWNILHWTAARVALIATSVAADIIAIQETHLASGRQACIYIMGGQSLLWLTRSTAARLGWDSWAAKAYL